VDFLVFQVAADEDFIFGPTLYLQPLEHEQRESPGPGSPVMLDISATAGVSP
jgi:hypothetical protein